MDTTKVVVELTVSKDGKQKDQTEEKHKNFRLTTNCQTNHCQHQQGKGKKATISSKYQLFTIYREVARHPLLTIKQIFEDAGIQGLPRTSRCHILKLVAKAVKANIRPPLTNRHKILRIERYTMKTSKQFFLQTSIGQPLIARIVGSEDGWLLVSRNQHD